MEHFGRRKSSDISVEGEDDAFMNDVDENIVRSSDKKQRLDSSNTKPTPAELGQSKTSLLKQPGFMAQT